MNKLIFSIVLSAALSITSFANTSNDTKNHIQNTLYQAGLQAIFDSEKNLKIWNDIIAMSVCPKFSSNKIYKSC